MVSPLEIFKFSMYFIDLATFFFFLPLESIPASHPLSTPWCAASLVPTLMLLLVQQFPLLVRVSALMCLFMFSVRVWTLHSFLRIGRTHLSVPGSDLKKQVPS